MSVAGKEIIMSSDTYTPTTTDLIRFAVQHDHPTFGRGWFFSPDAIESYATEVAAKAWDEGARFVLDTGWVDGDDAPPNPYRARLSSGGEG